jgi:hypothetical protein
MAYTNDLSNEQNFLARILEWITIQSLSSKPATKCPRRDDTYMLTVRQAARKFEGELGSTRFNRAINDV